MSENKLMLFDDIDATHILFILHETKSQVIDTLIELGFAKMFLVGIPLKIRHLLDVYECRNLFVDVVKSELI